MISIIAAFTKNRVMGKMGVLPWHLPEDMQLFKKLTTNQTVIMGRKTYDSLPPKFKPLPNRHNIIISRSMEAVKGIDICHSVGAGIEKAKSYGQEIFIIGGASIYAQALPYAATMYLSHVREEYDGDTYFPKFEEGNWEIIEIKEFADFTLKIYRRKA